MKYFCPLFFTIIFTFYFITSTGAQPVQNLRDYIKENYTKREEMIPMRDGVKLFTVLYEPKNKSNKYPILLNRTPFSVFPYGKDENGQDWYKPLLGPSDLFAREGFIFVYQDVRGLWQSEGKFEHLRPAILKSTTDTNESTDAYDTIDWLLKNTPNNNGRVGIYGVSYAGFYASAALINSHPAIKAASPQAPVSDCFLGDDFHHNGALILAQNYPFYTFFDDPTRLKINDFSFAEPFKWETEDGYGFFLRLGGLKEGGDFYAKAMGVRSKFWDETAAHSNYDGFWKDRNNLPKLKNIKTPVMTVGGWFDNEDLYGALRTYQYIEKQNPGIFNVLVMGPWAHNTWSRVAGDWLGTAYFGQKTAVDYRTKFELPFFNFYLKDKGDISNLKEVNVFDTGANRWISLDGYNPANSTPVPIYLSKDKKLSFQKPTAKSGFDEYVSDPLNPVPFTQQMTMGYPPEFMTEDQRFVSNRPDVLVYQSEVLNEDLTVAGDIKPQLFVSTSGTDSDFIVKLIDVFPLDFCYPEGKKPPEDAAPPNFEPGGYEMLLRGEPFPARFRNSFERPEAMKPNLPTEISFVMPGIVHTFKKGHRIMLQIQSTWFPLVARNPQKFVPNYNLATIEDFKKATERVYFGKNFSSRIILSVVKF
ncbi:MAG TPA: CocE/NonD family hydrolase [Pyrinomonadaceae bacterium]|nr:CocE/NonD family hydrolase [Pyrinomonadaceae bacterium]